MYLLAGKEVIFRNENEDEEEDVVREGQECRRLVSVWEVCWFAGRRAW